MFINGGKAAPEALPKKHARLLARLAALKARLAEVGIAPASPPVGLETGLLQVAARCADEPSLVRAAEEFLRGSSGARQVNLWLRDAGPPLAAGCLCHHVLHAEIPAGSPGFTAQGDFWAGHLDRWQTTVPVLCDTCSVKPGESLGLFALRTGTETLGLLRVAGRRDRLSPPGAAAWEPAAAILALALSRLRAAEALARQTRLHQAVLQAAPGMLAVKDHQGVYRDVNPTFCRFLGLPPEAIIGRTDSDLFDISPATSPPAGGPLSFDASPRGSSGNRRFHVVQHWLDPAQGPPGGVLISASAITARKDTEDEHRHTAERLQLALAASHAAWWDWDVSSGATVWSPELFVLLGLDPDQDASSIAVWESRLHPDDRAATLRTLQHSLDTRTELRAEYRVLLPDGRIRWLSALGRAIYDDQGRPLRMLGICLDITQRKLAEAERDASQAKLDAALASITDAAFISDTTGRFLHFNDAFVSYLRFRSRAEFAQSLEEIPSFLDVRTPDGCPAPRHTWPAARALRGETGTNVELLLRRKDTGESWSGSYSYAPILDASHNIAGALVVIRDITGQKRIQQRLADSESRYRTLVETAFDWVWEVDEEGRYTYVSPRVQELLGYHPDEILGRSPFSLMPDQEARRVRALFAEAAAACQPLTALENINRHKDGRLVVLETSALPVFGPAGEFCGYRGVDRDITERKKAEQALIHSRDLMRYVLEHMRSAVAVLDRDLRFLYVSQQYLRDYRVAEPDIIGKHHYDVFPDLPQKWRDVHQRALQGEVLHAEDDPFDRADGTREWTRWECRPWFDDAGAIGGIIVYTEVITKRKLAEDALRESEAQHRAILQTAMDGFLRIDLQGRFLEVNDTYCRMSGYTREELLSLNLRDLEARETPEQIQASIQSIVNRGESRFEACHRRKDGSVYPVEISVQYKPEKTRQLVVFIRDLTERHRALQALQESESRWAYALEGAGDGVWDWNPQTNAVHFTRQWKAILGYDDAEIENRLEEWTSRIHPDDRDAVLAKVQSHLRGETPSYLCEHRLRCKDGSYKWILDRGKVFAWTPDGLPLRMIGTHSDLTELKRAEEDRDRLRRQLVQAQKMESIGRLAGGVAHDFNNLLTVINGYSQLALNSLNPDDPLRPPLQQISKAGERAAALTGQLLAFSRKQVMQPRPLDLNLVLADMLPMLEHLASGDISIQFVPCAGQAPVNADPHQIEQVVLNLAVNARDAMPRGGTLRIATRLDQNPPPGKPAGPCVVLSVSDSGAGMDEVTRQRIFEPFFTTKPFGQGTGLGLSIVYGIVEQSGGYIEVDSEPGRGATFHVRLPLLPGGLPEPSAPPAAPVQPGKGTVLVVEDRPDVRAYAASALRSFGFDTLEAATAAEALDLCAQGQPPLDLVLTDIVMPRLNGRDLAARLAALRPGLRVLFMTGSSGGADTLASASSAPVMQKPFSPEELAAKVSAVLAAPPPPPPLVVADDEPGVRSYLRTVLENSGYNVLEAADGRDALALARQTRARLVITDLVMPEQEGIETIRALRREMPGVGIIAISGAFGGQMLKTARLLGADAVLHKPVMPDQVLACVSGVLARRA